MGRCGSSPMSSWRSGEEEINAHFPGERFHGVSVSFATAANNPATSSLWEIPIISAVIISRSPGLHLVGFSEFWLVLLGKIPLRITFGSYFWGYTIIMMEGQSKSTAAKPFWGIYSFFWSTWWKRLSSDQIPVRLLWALFLSRPQCWLMKTSDSQYKWLHPSLPFTHIKRLEQTLV